MHIHLIDGTYELFRFFYGAPSRRVSGPSGHGSREVGAARQLARSFLALLDQPAVTHVAVAFDTVIESFRNELFDGYKTGEGIDPDLWSQAPLVERVSHALGLVVWSMVEFEADDAMATGACRYGLHPDVDQVVLCSPDKDLAQCVRERRVVMWDRRQDTVLDETAVEAKFGVPPASIPDYLALVGDTADGIPGIPRWGPKSAAAVLARWGHLDAIPPDAAKWDVQVRGAQTLADNLAQHRTEVALYRRLATLRTDVPLPETLEDLAWQGARRAELEAVAQEVDDPDLVDRVSRWRA